jgi:CheY-like chemotaxis protein
MTTVLVVEDNDDVREMMSLALRLAGIRVMGASNGREALHLLRQQPLPCVIILDLMMPVMNGWQLRAALAEDARLAGIPVIVVSAMPDDLRQRPGVIEYLPKPVDIDRLLNAIYEHCP